MTIHSWNLTNFLAHVTMITCVSTYDVTKCDMFKFNLRADGIKYLINVTQNDQFARFLMNIKLWYFLSKTNSNERQM